MENTIQSQNSACEIWGVKVAMGQTFFLSVSIFLSKFIPAMVHIHSTIKKKRRAIPLQACTGPYGSRRVRLPDF
jgi:hypothetical protein